jgi:hypothetical protein
MYTEYIASKSEPTKSESMAIRLEPSEIVRTLYVKTTSTLLGLNMHIPFVSLPNSSSLTFFISRTANLLKNCVDIINTKSER